jgi:hypothetical protein
MPDSTPPDSTPNQDQVLTPDDQAEVPEIEQNPLPEFKF